MKTKVYEPEDYSLIVKDLLAGKVVGFPTETVYGLAIAYNNKNAFDRLYAIKNRSLNKPISMMVFNSQVMENVAYINYKQRRVIQQFMPGPLTVVLKAKANLPDFVTFHYSTVGIRIPTNKVALDILKEVKIPLLVTSANLANEPSLIKAEDVLQRFDGQISSMIRQDAFMGKASTVVDLTHNSIKILREGPILKEEINHIWEEKMKKIAIACDHGGLDLKKAIQKHYQHQFEFIDCGTNSTQSCDYPDFAIKAAELVANQKADFGIVICKSGIGMSIAANKVKGVRCALVDNVINARLCHQHNNANVLALGANDVTSRMAYKIIDAYNRVEFESRHQTRIDKINSYENKS